MSNGLIDGATTFDISDSTDWLGTGLASLAPVEAGLRCHVCKDFYKTPMITACSHTFCSLCIRHCLSSDGKCPLCRTTNEASKLRTNWVLEELTEAFTRARPGMLEFARSNQKRSPAKRKPSEAGLEHEQGDAARRRVTRSSTRQTSPLQDVVDIRSPEGVEGDEDYIPDDGLVACPICGDRLKLETINQHLDGCTVSKPTATPPNPNNGSRQLSKPTNDLIPLPSLSYGLLKDQPLRKKLADLGIPTMGTRQELERRHKEWVTLWNANCDAANPRRKRDLIQDLDTWERTQGARAQNVRNGLNTASQVASKDFDGKSWQTKHQDSFKDLVANARRNIPKTKPPTPVTNEDGTDAPKLNEAGTSLSDPWSSTGHPMLPFVQEELAKTEAGCALQMEKVEKDEEEIFRRQATGERPSYVHISGSEGPIYGEKDGTAAEPRTSNL